jgi:hypothetical protein
MKRTPGILILFLAFLVLARASPSEPMRAALSATLAIACADLYHGFRVKRFLFTIAGITAVAVLLRPSFVVGDRVDAAFWGVAGAIVCAVCVSNWVRHGDIPG